MKNGNIQIVFNSSKPKIEVRKIIDTKTILRNRGLYSLENIIKEYNWEYRKKVCVNCNSNRRKRLDCQKFDNFREGIQETHCKKLINARTRKFRKLINSLLKI